MKKKNFGLQGKMVLSYSVILGVVILILTWMAYRFVVNIEVRNARVNLEQLSEKTLTQVEAYLLEMEKVAQQVCADEKIINAFSNLQNADRPENYPENYFEKNIMEGIDLSTQLTSINGPSALIWRINVYNRHGDFISSGASLPVKGVSAQMNDSLPMPIDALMERLLIEKNKHYITPAQKDRWSDLYEKSLFISLFRPITDYYAREIYGVVEIQQEFEKLESLLSLEKTAGIYTFVFDQEGNQVLPSNITFEDATAVKYHSARNFSQEFGWSVILVQSHEHLMNSYQSLILLIYAFGILSIGGTFFIVYLVSRRFSRPIVELSNRVRNISIGSIPSSIGGGSGADEVRDLNHAFTSMLKRLQDSISVEQRSYLLALQSQMNPHFLYNSLAVIGSMGLEEGNDRVAEACDKLGNLLRYSASYDTRDTTLQQEIENVINYLSMMKLRFEHQFTYTVDVAAQLIDMPVPRLLIQPVVENCFEHGFKGKLPPWEVHIRASVLEEGRWEISIWDNGHGFSADDLAELNRKVATYSKDLSSNYKDMKLGGIGLVNTIIRLNLTIGEELEWEIKNRDPEGTEIIFRGGLNDTDIDC